MASIDCMEHGTNDLAPVSIKTFIEEVKERQVANFDKFMVYKVDKDNADVTLRPSKTSGICRKVPQKSWNQVLRESTQRGVLYP